MIMIPKIIHYCWLSGDSFPQRIEDCINSWKRFMPDYEIMLWDLTKFDINKIPWTKQAFEKHKYAFASDYIRFYALYNYGGIYLDSDVEVKKPFDELLKLDFFCGYEYEGLPEAAIVGSLSGQLWTKYCMEWYEDKDFVNADGSYNMKVAPIVMQYGLERALNVKLIDRNKVDYYQKGSYAIFPYIFFSPKNSFNGEIETNSKSYTIHHFNADWTKGDKVTKAKKKIHLLLIKILGRQRYINIMYIFRKLNKGIKD